MKKIVQALIVASTACPGNNSLRAIDGRSIRDALRVFERGEKVVIMRQCDFDRLYEK